jgi:putative transcriptional regulator
VNTLRGKLLVAGPGLLDPNFARTVVLVAAHSAEGALGIVLNRPSETEVGGALPDFAELAGDDELVHVGGPVEAEAVLALAELADPALLGEVLVGNALGLVTADLDPEAIAPEVLRARVYSGYAGWGPEQLDAEIEREDWIVADPVEDDVFCAEASELWGSVLGRMGGSYALLARMPLDPSVN